MKKLLLILFFALPLYASNQPVAGITPKDLNGECAKAVRYSNNTIKIQKKRHRIAKRSHLHQEEYSSDTEKEELSDSMVPIVNKKVEEKRQWSRKEINNIALCLCSIPTLSLTGAFLYILYA